jgi:hypothetical protein
VSELLDQIGTPEWGDILYRGETGWVLLPHGTSGQALTSGGHGANPSWTSVSSGLPPKYLSGLGTSFAADADHDITIAVGKCRDSSDTYDLVLSSPITKRIDASWAAGSGNGGMFTGSVTYNAVYHLFLIRKDSDGSIDAGWDTSVTAANIPAGYTAYRRIWSMFSDGSANLLEYEQNGDWCTLYTRVRSLDSVAGMTEAAQVIKVPTGFRVRARLRAEASSPSPGAYFGVKEMYAEAGYVNSSLLVRCQVADILISGAGESLLWTDTSAQVRVVAYNADVVCSLIVSGWVDSRGKDD